MPNLRRNPHRINKRQKDIAPRWPTLMTKFHYPAHTIGDSTMEWCNVCRRDTKRMIYAVATSNKAGIGGPCLEHTVSPLSQKQLDARRKRREESHNPTLFNM